MEDVNKLLFATGDKTKNIESATFLRTWCLDKGTGLPTTIPPSTNHGKLHHLWWGRIPMEDVNKLLFATGDHNNVTVSSGDKRNISRLLICHPILLNSPFVEPAGIDLLLDNLLLERHPYTVSPG